MKRSGLRRTSGLRRVSAKRRAKLEAWRDLQMQVRERSEGRCELRTPACTGGGGDTHHLLPRSQGGLDTLDNCVDACRACHDHAHYHPAEAYAAGWLRHSWQDEADR